MRWVTMLLLGVLLLLQWPLWFGERSWPQVRQLRVDLEAQHQANDQARQQNQRLENEAHDLRHGMQAVQDRARREMGMVKPDEIFVQVLPASSPLPPTSPTGSQPAANTAKPKPRH
ncbi:Cell division protein FtsB (modular protein) [Thiomonas sp. X19]|uniref:cell division protein FtsB n=1 Tax=Thiomonas sp. X19 TaxID=1050370 RepID=UPI000B73E0C8|nr:cell division protein FtsB [Thiomonas sp. X19]SCC95412.1 Cell division protein FtsB (modular protein) [Thiomonas sp. X19]